MSRKRLNAALALLGLTMICASSVVLYGFNPMIIELWVLGLALTSIYIWNDGVPAWLVRVHNLLSDGGLTADDDQRNLAPRVYLPVLMLGLAIGWWLLMPFLLKSSVSAFHPMRCIWIGLAVLVGLVLNLRHWWAMQYWRRHQFLACLKCNYPLEGLPNCGDCPECGTQFKADEVRLALRRRFRAWWR